MYTFEIIALLRRYAAQSGSYRSFGTTYRSHLQGSNSARRLQEDCLNLDDGTDRLSRNVGNYQSTLRAVAFSSVLTLRWPRNFYKCTTSTISTTSTSSTTTWIFDNADVWLIPHALSVFKSVKLNLEAIASLYVSLLTKSNSNLELWLLG